MSPIIRLRLAEQRQLVNSHPLPGTLIVSLTSYRPRFRYLDLALVSLLDQTIRPDRLILWVAEHEMKYLPRSVMTLQSAGLEIRGTQDLKSYKKLIPTIARHPDAFIATADDDVFYPRTWLATLCDGQNERSIITCHRAHRIPPPAPDGLCAYRDWEWDVLDSKALTPSSNLLATGVGGVLYPPRSLHSDVTNDEMFMCLCPQADDLWFYWMARRAGSQYVKVGPRFPLLHLPGTTENGLFNMGVNDAQIANLFNDFGPPFDG